MPRRLAVSVLVACSLTTVFAFAQGDAKPAGAQPGPAEVKQSIKRGLEYLRGRQTEKGNWAFERETPVPDQPTATPKMQEDPTYNLGVTALVALAMLENGVLPSDPSIQKAYNYVKDGAATNKHTYNLGLTILFLTRMGSHADRPLIQRLARRLMGGQFDGGDWPYECPIDSDVESSRPGQQHMRKSGIGDNSNTQFAVLGLWAATRAGAQVDEALELVGKRFRGSQAESGGWDYQSTGKADSNAMTCAGMYALTVTAAAANRKAGSTASAAGKSTDADAPAKSDTGLVLSARAALAEDAVFKKGLTRIEQFANEIGPSTSPYFLWSIERLGVTLQMPKFGSVDWYAKGSKALVESQKSDGSWATAWKGTPDTAFGLLFLRKANLGRDISYALTGDASKPFVLIAKDKPQAFAKLKEAVAAAADGDAIEIMGHGPFDVAGLTIAGKSLTLRGGEGFEPVLAHKVELLQDVDADNLRFVLAVQKARLSLEGIRVQIDPTQKSKEGFTAIALDGAELRATNCNFTQSNSAVASGVELRGASKVALQNCMFAGFARAIDAQVSADQEVSVENCLIYSRLGLMAKSATAKDAGGLTVQLTRNTFHVVEVINLGGLAGAAEFNADANIFHTSVFSAGLRPSASSPAVRKWDGRRNVFDLTRWLTVAGQSLREVNNLDTWRKYWKTKEEGSFSRSVPFAVKNARPYAHNISPNDWRVTVERLSPDLGGDVQLGCDVYLVGAGQPYFQFRESIAYDTWRGGSGTGLVSANGAPVAPSDDAKLMDGTWLATDAELAGQKLPAEALKTFKLILKGNDYTVETAAGADRGTIKLEPDKQPKAMDIIGVEGPNKGKTFLAIFEMKGDTLRICYDLSGQSRPTEFATKAGTALFLAVYKREGK